MIVVTEASAAFVDLFCFHRMARWDSLRLFD